MSLMTRSRLEVRPLAGALGAEIHGVDLSGPLAGQHAAIRHALLEHLVIFFRGQHLTAPAVHGPLRVRWATPVEYPLCKGPARAPRDRRGIRRSWSTNASTSAGSGTPTPLICNARRWARCCLRSKCRRSGVTRCSPTSTSRTKHCPRACGGCWTGWWRCTALPRRTSRARAKIACAPTRATTHGPNTLPSIRSCTRIPRPAARSLYVNVAHTARFKDIDRGRTARRCSTGCHRHQVQPQFTLPLPLAGRLARLLGQPLHAAQPD